MALAGGASAILAGNPTVSGGSTFATWTTGPTRSGCLPGLPPSIRLETAAPAGWLDMGVHREFSLVCEAGRRRRRARRKRDVVKISIDWVALGEVFLVSFAAAVGLIVLFSLGVSSLATTAESQRATDKPASRTTSIPPVALLCFLACALIVAYGLYLIIIK